MKKIHFLLGALMLASTSVFTSCFSNDIPEIVINGNAGGGTTGSDGVQIGDVIPAENYTFTIICNVTANIYINGSRVASSSKYIGKGGIGEKILIKANTTVPGFSEDEIVKELTLDSNGKIVRLNFAKIPTSATASDLMPYALSVNDANSMTNPSNPGFKADTLYVENKKENKKEPYPGKITDARMAIYNDLVTNAISKGIDPKMLFTITAREAVLTGIDQNVKEGSEWFPVLTLICTPDGADFGDKPAIVTVKNPNFERGMRFQCLGAVQDAAVISNKNGGEVTMKFPHFSDYIIESQANVKKVGESTIKTQSLLDCKVGNHKYTYMVYSGCKYDYDTNDFINKYLVAKFGPKAFEGSGEITISNLSSRATIPYTITQKVYKYKVEFGDITVNVDVYGPEDVFVDTDNAVIYDATKHSGGSAF